MAQFILPSHPAEQNIGFLVLSLQQSNPWTKSAGAPSGCSWPEHEGNVDGRAGELLNHSHCVCPSLVSQARCLRLPLTWGHGSAVAQGYHKESIAPGQEDTVYKTPSLEVQAFPFFLLYHRIEHQDARVALAPM